MRFQATLHTDTKIAELERKLEESINGLYDGDHEIWYREPENLRPGRVIYVDGTDFDPGSGEGLDRRTLANKWVFIG